MLDDEHGHHDHHGTGVRWLDLTVTAAVVLISLISLAVSIGHGRVMEELVAENRKMVAATTVPFLEVWGDNIDRVSGRSMASIVLANDGVGPAIIDWLEVRVRGQPVAGAAALMKACCAPPPGRLAGFSYSTPSGRVLPAKEKIDVIRLEPTDAKGRLVLATFLASQGQISARACYCSVLDDCWVTLFDSRRPTRVESCRAPSVARFR
jgi:hypothetical protein